MPKFSDLEKKKIEEKLFTEGAYLFTQYGVKKVTVDDLAKAAGIAKGSFYAFYQSKEHLYLEIAGRMQQQMWREMDGFLEENRFLSPEELTKKCFLWMFSELPRYPMLYQADAETAGYLYRKLPPELIESHTKDDRYEMMKLKEYGVRFKQDDEVTVKILQTLAISFLNLYKDPSADPGPVMNVMLDGVLKELIL